MADREGSGKYKKVLRERERVTMEAIASEDEWERFTSIS